MFLYWGRRGALSQLTLAVARAAVADRRIEATVSISRQNESFAAYCELGDALLAVDTFHSDWGALTNAWRIPLLQHIVRQRLERARIQAVITLMPHVWSPFIAPVVRKAGARYVTIVHDAVAHKGDSTSLVHGWCLKDIRHADLVLTLTDTVAGQLLATGKVTRARLATLFHPDICYGPTIERRPPVPGEPLRLLFLGRILLYKGLPLFLDAVDMLAEKGIAVKVGVFGEGNLGPCATRLTQMDAEVVNRWLTEAEIGAALTRYHVLVLSHVEASQSGVAAASFGGGLPVVANPIGGLIEQVEDGVTGILAKRASAPALADAIQRLLTEPQLYRTICENIRKRADQRSATRFVEQVVAHALNARA